MASHMSIAQREAERRRLRKLQQVRQESDKGTVAKERSDREDRNRVLHKELQHARNAHGALERERQRLAHTVAFPGLGRRFKHEGMAEVAFGDTLATMKMSTAPSSTTGQRLDSEAGGGARIPEPASCINVEFDYTSGRLRWEQSGTRYRGQITRSKGRNAFEVTGNDGSAFSCVEEVVGSTEPSKKGSASKRPAGAVADLAWQMDGLKAEQELERRADLARSKARAEAKPGGAWGSAAASRATRVELVPMVTCGS